MQEISSGKKEMSDAVDIAFASDKIQSVFNEDLGSIEQRITVAARDLKWTWSKAKRVWYGEITFLRSHEKEALERAEIREARRAHARYIQKTADLAAFLERQDADFHRPSIEGLRGVISRVDRTRNS